jgi:hypothetical protein
MKEFLIFAIFLITSNLYAQSEFESPYLFTKEQKIEFLDSLNKYRDSLGVPKVQYSFQEDSLSRLRISSIFNHIDSIGEEEYKKDIIENQHHNWKQDWDNYDKNNVDSDTVLSEYAECTARLSRLYNSDDLVTRLFKGWKNSPAHWKEMMNPKYQYITLDCFIDNYRHIRLRKGYFSALVLFSKGVNQNTRGN